jgi:hypothetical protein
MHAASPHSGPSPSPSRYRVRLDLASPPLFINSADALLLSLSLLSRKQPQHIESSLSLSSGDASTSPAREVGHRGSAARRVFCFFSHGDRRRGGGGPGRPGREDPGYLTEQEASAVAGVGREGAGHARGSGGARLSAELVAVAEAETERREAARMGQLALGAEEAGRSGGGGAAAELPGVRRRAVRVRAVDQRRREGLGGVRRVGAVQGAHGGAEPRDAARLRRLCLRIRRVLER